MELKFTTLLDLLAALPNEQAAIDHFRAVRWKNGAFCPYCGSTKIYHFANKRTHKCGDCRQRFSIKVGTIFEDSNIGLRTWMLAIWFITSHKKGIASTQLAKDLGVTQKTAWFIMHRLRHASRTPSFNRQLSGIVEADEAFIGGKEGNKPARKRGLRKKAIVFGMLERDGELRAGTVTHLGESKERIEDHIEPGAALLTDEWPGYRRVARNYAHYHVNHAAGEYVRAGVHVNSVEGYWSQLKRQIYGIHHWVSAKHLGRYVDESVWRFNRRAMTEADRFNALIAAASGRLTYRELTADRE